MYRNMKQQGFSLIMAIFLVVVLGGIAVFIGRVTSMQIQSSALDEEGAMAYHAARSGLEWGVYQAIVGSSCDVPTSFPLAVPTTLTSTSTVNYTVTVDCTYFPLIFEGSTPVYLYQITATACNNSNSCPATTPGSMSVERQLTATVSK